MKKFKMTYILSIVKTAIVEAENKESVEHEFYEDKNVEILDDEYTYIDSIKEIEEIKELN